VTRRPFDQNEIGDLGRDMDPALADLDRYLADTAENPSAGFADHVMAALEQQPAPRRGALGALLAFVSTPGGGGRVALMVATVMVAILAVVAIGRIDGLLPSHVGTTTPEPTRLVSPSPEPSPSLTPSPSERAPRSPRSSDPPTGSPQASDDGPDIGETPEPGDHG
jgi:hypothetical protein